MNKKYLALAILITAAIVGGVLWFSHESTEPQTILKGASGLAGYQQIATSTNVGPDEIIQIFSNRNMNCASRVISSKASALSISFGDPSNGDIASTTLTSMVGFYQAASTTVVYDAELFGCGRWFVHSVASSTITTAEF